jgi:hypothetical protein
MTRPHKPDSDESSFQDPLVTDSPAQDSETADWNADPLLARAIADWKAAVPRVALAERVVNQWQADRTRVQPAGSRVRSQWLVWAVSAAACVAVLFVAQALQQPPVRPGESNPSLASRPATPPAENDVPAVRPAPSLETARLGATHSDAAATGSVTTELVGDVRAAVRGLTTDAAAPVADLLAMAWSSPKSIPSPEAADGGQRWMLVAPPLQELDEGLQPITRPLGAAVDFLLDRLDDDEHGAS